MKINLSLRTVLSCASLLVCAHSVDALAQQSVLVTAMPTVAENAQSSERLGCSINDIQRWNQRIKCPCTELQWTKSSSDSDCKAYFEGGYWHVVGACKNGCYCDVPAIVAGAEPTGEEVLLPCVVNENATSDIFFVKVSSDSGIFRLCLDKAQVEMFREFKVRIGERNQPVVWEIDAQWVDSYVAIPSAGTTSSSDVAAAVITLDTMEFGDIAVTETFALPTDADGDGTLDATVKKIKFGHWELAISYFGG